MRSFTTGLIAGCAALAIAASSALAQSKVEIIYSDTVPETDIRTTILRKEFGECLGAEFDFKSYHGATLFKQGTELTAMQRGNLDMANLAVFDFYNQVPQTAILGTAYLYRDYAHMRAVTGSEVLNDIWKQIEEKAGVKVLSNPYIGTRHLNLKGEKKIMVPADLAGVKLRMPGGDAWQFLGQSIGANPVPMAYAEVYTGLQTGAIDGQDNPLPNVQNMKFYEVSNQIVLTSHLVGFDLLTVSARTWRAMSEAKRAQFQAAADAAVGWSNAEHAKKEGELVAFFKAQGLDVYEPNLPAFRSFAQKKYLASDLAKAWPAGMVDKINAL